MGAWRFGTKVCFHGFEGQDRDGRTLGNCEMSVGQGETASHRLVGHQLPWP
jgi:hypothetical protein